MNINKVMLAGRTAKIFDLKYFSDGTASLPVTLATSEHWTDGSGQRQERTEFHRVIFLGRAADIVQRYLEVGQELYVCGKLTHRRFGEGELKQFITEVRVDDMDFEFGVKAKPASHQDSVASKAIARPARRG